MSDYIKREDALSVIYGQHIGGKEACENARPNTFGADLREIAYDIEGIPAADVVERPRWIPVTKRLPEEGEWVLIWGDGYHVPFEGFLVSGSWIDDQFERHTVTHWMPLPEPPKEET